MSRTHDLRAKLTAWLDTQGGLHGAAIVTTGGVVIASALPSLIDPSRLGELGAQLSKAAPNVASALFLGAAEYNVVFGEAGLVGWIALEPHIALLVLAPGLPAWTAPRPWLEGLRTAGQTFMLELRAALSSPNQKGPARVAVPC